MQTTHARPTLTDGPVRLRAPKAEDIAARFKLGNTAEIHHMFGADPAKVQPITKAQATSWFHAQEAEPLAWVIDYRKRLAGALRLHSLDHHDRRASLAVGILNPKLLGKGIGTRAIHLIVAHAFDALKLHRLTLRVVDYNDRAIAAYKKVGFVIEGREREAARVGDAWHDDVIMGLLASDYAKGQAA
ncbi:GCN5-related N-acetyltransferase [Sulfitobacter noctilucicola]|uniref:RimJ/RimL family protein N-acetyltransferase n=1 Tax=Sulfitobacter noctilucicola TaxID=1342301 RepID=A0A7W6M7F3_9RHOB|nr:GNAT family protein [Sulfitobacter noctilucicola]KIN65042.1 GCN5-related N-acetyltransferase [Sulfitobacter noctilucicola]MBB4173819.1 RimJ/RimL family protein N-acetyltransferase [Sulfitobacter noctilucicola]